MKTKIARHSITLTSLVFALAIAMGLGQPLALHAATINVGCDVTELINVLDNANANADADTLELAANCVYTLTQVNNIDTTLGPNGLPVITSEIIINGNGATIARDASAPQFRLFQINAGAVVTFNQVTLTGGDPGFNTDGDGLDGGAIHNSGTCNLNDTTIHRNHAGDGRAADPFGTLAGDGGRGGGLFNKGTAIFNNATVSQNRAGSGNCADELCYGSTRGGDGGGIYNLGALTLNQSRVLENTTTDTIGNRGGSGVGSGGGIFNLGTVSTSTSEFSDNETGNGGGYMLGDFWGNGGAVYNQGEFNITSSSFARNKTGANFGASGDASGGAIYNAAAGQLNVSASQFVENMTGIGGSVYEGVNGGNGGAIANAGTLSVAECTFEQNETGMGGSNSFHGGEGGSGGAIYSVGVLQVLASTFFQNKSGNGGGSSDIGGSGGSGGGIYAMGSALITNSTFHANHTGARVTGPAGNGSDGFGGAIQSDGQTTLVNVTISGNAGGAHPKSGTGAGLSGTFTVKNSIIADNSPGRNCVGTITNGGGNLRFPKTDASCVGTFANPKLGALQDNGGATQTMLLAPDSPAINAAVDANCLATDQRGVARPQGKRCDIGALELEPPTPPALRQPRAGSVLNKATVELKWRAAERAVEYRVLVRAASPKGKKVVNQKISTVTYTTPQLGNGKYYWRVKACSRVRCIESLTRDFEINIAP